MSKKTPLIDRLDAFLCSPHEDTPEAALILEAKEQIEAYRRALTVGELGEAVHTAIRRMPPREWVEILETAIHGLKIQNGIDDHG